MAAGAREGRTPIVRWRKARRWEAVGRAARAIAVPRSAPWALCVSLQGRRARRERARARAPRAGGGGGKKAGGNRGGGRGPPSALGVPLDETKGRSRGRARVSRRRGLGVLRRRLGRRRLGVRGWPASRRGGRGRGPASPRAEVRGPSVASAPASGRGERERVRRSKRGGAASASRAAAIDAGTRWTGWARGETAKGPDGGAIAPRPSPFARWRARSRRVPSSQSAARALGAVRPPPSVAP